MKIGVLLLFITCMGLLVSCYGGSSGGGSGPTSNHWFVASGDTYFFLPDNFPNHLSDFLAENPSFKVVKVQALYPANSGSPEMYIVVLENQATVTEPALEK